jgi:hypothetical protein
MEIHTVKKKVNYGFAIKSELEATTASLSQCRDMLIGIREQFNGTRSQRAFLNDVVQYVEDLRRLTSNVIDMSEMAQALLDKQNGDLG